MNKKLKLWELDRVSEEEFKQQKKFPIIVILDNIRSLNNIGSFFRTSDAFNVEKIYTEMYCKLMNFMDIKISLSH